MWRWKPMKIKNRDMGNQTTGHVYAPVPVLWHLVRVTCWVTWTICRKEEQWNYAMESSIHWRMWRILYLPVSSHLLSFTSEHFPSWILLHHIFEYHLAFLDHHLEDKFMSVAGCITHVQKWWELPHTQHSIGLRWRPLASKKLVTSSMVTAKGKTVCHRRLPETVEPRKI